MIQEIQVRVLPVVASSEQNIKRFVAEDRGIDIRTINAVRVLKRSIDARQRKIFINLTVRLYINEMPEDDAYVVTEYGDVSGKPAVIVVGEGPGGLFASLRLIELGLRPIVLERGKNVRDRKVDLANIKKTRLWMPRAIIASEKVEPALIRTANSIHDQRSVAARRKSLTYSASTGPPRLSLPTLIPISARTNCRR